MIEVLPQTEGNLLAVKATHKLTNQDYKETLIPRLEAIVRDYGRARFIIDLSNDFHGWDVSAMWDDVRFGVTNRNSFEKMAIVGGPKTVEWGTKLAKMFMSGEVKCFPTNAYNEAIDWVNEYATVPANDNYPTNENYPATDNYNKTKTNRTNYDPNLVETCTGK